MNNFKEEDYLNNALNLIKKELHKEESIITEKRDGLVASRRYMWEESAHSSYDFDKIPEMNHYLSEVDRNNKSYENTIRQIQIYIRMMDAPYFGRFDFAEDGFETWEKIYIGLHNLIDPETDDILIYDWRAPVSSIYYRYELGKAEYKSPVGLISGEISLKRQYKIINSELKYFFDCSVTINDDILQDVLCRNTSSNMRNIVETIQREQDLIIRNTENELLIVQGTAGSGKTSIALHRIAYLLYIGLNSKLNSNNVIIISPNSIFSKYISSVLPELGEENVNQITYDDVIDRFIDKSFNRETRARQLETLIVDEYSKKISIRLDSIKFKGSKAFIEILNRLIKYYEFNMILFEDVYYDGEVIENKEILKNLFLNNKKSMPIAKRLKWIENMILNKVHPKRKKRLEKIERIVQKGVEHEFEIKSFSRLLAIKETKVFMERLHKITEVDYFQVYKILFRSKKLFLELSKGLDVPQEIEKIFSRTSERLEKGYVSYEDSSPLIYIKLMLEGSKEFSDIKQVVIDEAQDYYPLQYEIFKLLFKSARYTVLGDFNQALEKERDIVLYDDIINVLDKKSFLKLFLNKSFRSSFEISSFAAKILNSGEKFIPFERHEEEPEVVAFNDNELMNQAIVKAVDSYHIEGYESVAIIFNTEKEALEIH
jgi:DNA helicase II / ATP-dependent DNA helicase PcrA